MDASFRKRVYSFTLRLIHFIDSLPGDRVTNRLCDQLIRSGTSIIGNLTEGEAGRTKRDFANYMNHALKSSKESHLWISLLRDSGRTTPQAVVFLEKELDEYIRIFTASMKTLRRSLQRKPKEDKVPH